MRWDRGRWNKGRSKERKSQLLAPGGLTTPMEHYANNNALAHVWSIMWMVMVNKKRKQGGRETYIYRGVRWFNDV